MVNLLACDSVVVLNPPMPSLKMGNPAPSIVQIDPPAISVVVRNPPSLTQRMAEPSVSGVVVLPVPGPPGSGSGTTEIFVQSVQPTEGSSAWYWFETDGAGNLTGNEYVYDPDGL